MIRIIIRENSGGTFPSRTVSSVRQDVRVHRPAYPPFDISYRPIRTPADFPAGSFHAGCIRCTSRPSAVPSAERRTRRDPDILPPASGKPRRDFTRRIPVHCCRFPRSGRGKRKGPASRPTLVPSLNLKPMLCHVISRCSPSTAPLRSIRNACRRTSIRVRRRRSRCR